MESEIEHTTINSDFFDKKKFQKQLDIIKQASELAQAKIDYASAHDDNIIRAIEVVEDFLRKKHRLCYGGQAINAHLPSKYKFYDPEYSVPDYDFFTPDQDGDIAFLVKELQRAGFIEISVREGMHEGTIKVYVDYVPVADMTVIDPKLYRILSKREYKLDGISYLDANSLRMLMYLELSRPRGEVGRWPKVFERLSLFNEFVESKPCKITKELFRGGLTQEQAKYTLNYIIDNKRVFAGANLLNFYDYALKSSNQSTNLIMTGKKPIIFYSPNAEADAKALQAEFSALVKSQKGGNQLSTIEGRSPKVGLQFRRKPISIKSFSSKGIDLIPSMKIITQGSKSLVFIIDQTACHSYFNIPIEDNKVMRIASMDTLITLYFSLGLVDSKYFDMGSMECLANQLVHISIRARENPDRFPFPFISIKCAGKQITLPSLIRAKVKRITQKKALLRKSAQNQQSVTKPNSRQRNNTIKKSQRIKMGLKKNEI
jgi:hypothetical protein